MEEDGGERHGRSGLDDATFTITFDDAILADFLGFHNLFLLFFFPPLLYFSIEAEENENRKKKLKK